MARQKDYAAENEKLKNKVETLKYDLKEAKQDYRALQADMKAIEKTYNTELQSLANELAALETAAYEQGAADAQSMISVALNDLISQIEAAPAQPAARTATAKRSTAAKATGRRRGRPPKQASETAATAEPKRRGRPPKAKTAYAPAAYAAEESAAPKKRRGRPPKKTAAVTAAHATAPKRRGRPPKKKIQSEIAAPAAMAESDYAASIPESIIEE